MNAIPDLIAEHEAGPFWPGEVNLRHRERMAEVIAERDEDRTKLAQYRAAVQTLAKQDFGADGWNEQCNQAAILLRNLLKNND